MSGSSRHQQRMIAAQHKIQSALAFDLESRLRGKVNEIPEITRYAKHLRVGINSAMAEHAGLAKLLIDKGVITEEEYREAMVQALEEEADRTESIVRQDWDLPDHVTFS